MEYVIIRPLLFSNLSHPIPFSPTLSFFPPLFLSFFLLEKFFNNFLFNATDRLRNTGDKGEIYARGKKIYSRPYVHWE